jgi:BMFP domain-containing protein YqiC
MKNKPEPSSSPNNAMKKLYLAFVLSLTALTAPAAVPVVDWAVLAQALMQVALASNQLAQAQELLTRLGDPGAIANIAGAAQTLGQMTEQGVSRSLPEIQQSTTGQSGQSYDGGGLYKAIQPEIPLIDGQTATRPVEAYRKHELLQQAIVNYHAVITNTQARRDGLRASQLETTRQLSAATTDAEVQKLKAVLASQQTELGTVTAERFEAATQVAVQKAANEADKARQQQAEDEERAASLQKSLVHALGFFKADNHHVAIPDPKKEAQ